MFKTKSIAMTLVVAGMVGLLCASLSAQQLYVDGAMNNDILRYDASFNPAPAPAQSGAMFFDLPSTLTSDGFPASQYQYKNLIAGSDGFLYFTAGSDWPYNGNAGYQWGPGKNYVRRIDMATGIYDSTWKVEVGSVTPYGDPVCGSMSIAPDGRLYVAETTKSHAYMVDTAGQTATAVHEDWYPGPVDNITFDDQGRAYTSSYDDGVLYRFNVSGASWIKDLAFWYVGIPSGRAYGLAWKDGWLYINNYYSFEGDQEVTKLYRMGTTGDWDGQVDPEWEVTLPGMRTGDMSFGPDGKLYVANMPKIARVDLATKVVEEVMDAPDGYTASVAWSTSTPQPPASLSISYKGRLLDMGLPVNGTAGIKLALFNAETGKHALWSTGASDVAVVNGMFSKNIGPVFPYLFQQKSDLWLEVTANGQVMSPRLMVAGSPYAAMSNSTDLEVAGTTPVANVNITYQGELLDDGQQIDGTASIKFDLFGAEIGGIALWSGTAGNVTVTGGVFTKDIGPVSPDLFEQHSNLWLQITANGQVVSPRVKLETAPYAARSFRTAP